MDSSLAKNTVQSQEFPIHWGEKKVNFIVNTVGKKIPLFICRWNEILIAHIGSYRTQQFRIQSDNSA